MAEETNRPRTGEPRRTHQPFSIDRLPDEVHEAIRFLRNDRSQGLTWPQIEERSARPYSERWKEDRQGFVDWDKLPTDVLELFPQLRIPKSNLHRWYHDSLLQVRDEVIEDGDAAQAFIEKLGAMKIEGMNDAVMHAMSREVFNLIQTTAQGDRLNLIEALNNTSLVLTRLQRLQLQQKKAEADIAKSEADKARFEAEAGDPRAIYMQAAQDILKKLNTRKPVRAVLETIQAELINEIAHGAEAFAKQVEASTA